LEQCKAQMKWNKQALEAWLEEAARKDEDAMIIQKYSTLDDTKIKADVTSLSTYLFITSSWRGVRVSVC